MENSSDPEYLKRQFDDLQRRNRITGVGGVTMPDGIKSHGNVPEESSKVFKERKDLMTYKNGVASFGVKKTSIPQARQRKDNTPPSSARIFAISEPKESKEKQK